MSSPTSSPARILTTILLLTFGILIQGAALGHPSSALGLLNTVPVPNLISARSDAPLPDDHAATLEGPPCCFASSCLSWTLDSTGRVLEGVCYNKKDQRGHWDKVESRLDLANCVGNFDGVLKGASDGAYSQTCSSCSLQDTTLTCLCKTPTAYHGMEATVDLNAFVQDYNGRLKCFDYVSNGSD